MTLKEKYEKIVNRYLFVFCKKYDLKFNQWIGNSALIDNKYFVTFEVIRYCIDKSVNAIDFFSYENFVRKFNKIKISFIEYHTKLTEYRNNNGQFIEIIEFEIDLIYSMI